MVSYSTISTSISKQVSHPFGTSFACFVMCLDQELKTGFKDLLLEMPLVPLALIWFFLFIPLYSWICEISSGIRPIC